MKFRFFIAFDRFIFANISRAPKRDKISERHDNNVSIDYLEIWNALNKSNSSNLFGASYRDFMPSFSDIFLHFKKSILK